MFWTANFQSAIKNKKGEKPRLLINQKPGDTQQSIVSLSLLLVKSMIISISNHP